MIKFTIELLFKTVGLVGGLLLGFCLIPQIIKSIRTESTNDIAYSWTIIYALGLIMLITYGIYFELWSIYAPACLELVCIIILFFLKLHYDGCKCCKETTLPIRDPLIE